MQSVMDIIEQLEKYRFEKKLSQEEIAERLGVAFSTVNRWFNRKSSPRKMQNYHIQKLIGLEKPHARKK
jgi:transcriptional regulator with XRE-family HTH domain